MVIHLFPKRARLLVAALAVTLLPEIHTVTFPATRQNLPQPFNPADPMQLLPQGTSHYDGVS